MNPTSTAFSLQLRAYEACQEGRYYQALEREEAREAAIAKLAAPHLRRMSRSPNSDDLYEAINECIDADQARIAKGLNADNATFGQLMRERFLLGFERVALAAAEARYDRTERIIEQEGEEPALDTGVDALTPLERRLATAAVQP